MISKSNIKRQERWSVRYCDEIDLEMDFNTVDQILSIPPFSRIDASKFRGQVSLRGILENDCRMRDFEEGEMVVRKGDWGNSAFFVLEGSLKAGLDANDGTVESNPEPRSPIKKPFLQRIARLWNRSNVDEYRETDHYSNKDGIRTRGKGKQTRIFLPDISQLLGNDNVAEIEVGQFFGELSALGRCARQATVVASTECRVLEIRWQGLRDLMRNDEGVRAHIDSIFRERALKWFLLNTSIFTKCTTGQIEALADSAQFETYGQYDWAGSFKRLSERSAENEQNLDMEPLIAQEGDHPNGVIIVRSGLARLTKRFENGQKTIGYLGPGQAFGVDEIVENWNAQEAGKFEYSLRSIGITTVVVVPTKTVERVLLADSEVSNKLGRQSNVAKQFGTIDQDLVEFLVNKRITNGTATMMIDMDRCTRCDDCVRACASTHGNNPRFLRDGPVQNNIMVANACMHCQDPVCMIECPTGAIQRDIDQGEVVINDKTCIGCKACANNCPYDAIRMVEIRQKDGQVVRDSESQLPITKATKCDLCFDHLGGPACQRACPHGALVRMDPQNVVQLSTWINR